MITKDQIEFEINGNHYLITAMDAVFGLQAMNQLAAFAKNDMPPSADFIKEVVIRSVTFQNKAIDEKWFNKHFSRNYAELNALFTKIIEFNFGDSGEDGLPNEQSDTSE